MSFGPNGNVGARYITQDKWDKVWERAPYEFIELIKSTLYGKLDSSNQIAIKNLEDVLVRNINLELTKLKELAQVYAESG